MVNNEGVPEVYQVHVHACPHNVRSKIHVFSPSGMLTPVNGLRLQLIEGYYLWLWCSILLSH